MLGVEFPVVAFTALQGRRRGGGRAGGFAVPGEAMHTTDEIAADIKWIAKGRGPAVRN
jgi:hypothetical protein